MSPGGVRQIRKKAFLRAFCMAPRWRLGCKGPHGIFEIVAQPFFRQTVAVALAAYRLLNALFGAGPYIVPREGPRFFMGTRKHA